MIRSPISSAEAMRRIARGSYTTLLLAAILGPAVLFAAMAWWSWDREEREALDRITRITSLLQEHSERLLQTDTLVLDRIDDRLAGATWPEIIAYKDELHHFLASLAAGVEGVEAAFVVDADGEMQATSRELRPTPDGTPIKINVRDRRYFMEARQQPGVVIDGPVIGRVGGEPVVDVVRRLRSPDGTFRGLAAIVISRKYLASTWSRLVEPGDTVTLVRDNGLVMIRYPEVETVPGAPPPRFSDAAVARLQTSDSGVMEATSAIDGVTRLDGYARLEGYPIHIVYAVDRRNIIRRWYPTLAVFGTLTAAATAGLLLTALAVIRRARLEAALHANVERAAAALEASEAKYRALFQKAPIPMHALDAESRIIDANDAWLKALGYTANEVIGRPISDFHPPGAQPVHATRWRQVLETGFLRDAERQYVKKSGEIMETLISAILERDASGAFVRVITGITDVTARRRAEEAAQRERQFSELLVRSSTEGIISIDRDFRYTLWNPCMEAISGLPSADIVGRTIFETFSNLPGVVEKAWRDALAGKRSSLRAYRFEYLKTGKSGILDEDFSPLFAEDQTIIGAIAFVRDVTEQRRMEDTLRQSQKMEVIGQLTGGVAHDFNNLLTVIIGNIDALRRHAGLAGSDAQETLERALRGATRAAALTQRLLAFSRRQPLTPQPLNLNRLVGGTSELLQRTLGEHIDVETVLAGGLWWIAADANQLESALLNLAVNARDAMTEGGRLTIETANVYLDDAYAAAHEEVKAGQYAMLAVSDTGSGMTSDVIGKAFEPFFTTKGVGQGTGLGLSQVYGFVKQSGGHVKIYSELGQGTTVKLYFPRLAATERSGEGKSDTPPAQAAPHGETILVVEDDDDVRHYSVDCLRELGYLVVDAPDADTALRRLDADPGIRLMFTDVGLPGDRNGRQLAEEAIQRCPRLKVLFTTGYARNAIVHHGRLDPGVDLLVKPFTYADLAAKVRQVLGEVRA
ncbi:MAG: PAS domain S-box protein [Alphaproteobacteria bacterium]|nr:PAS domain S-box protein [Alphaproteobacteria bacterium]